LSRIGFKGGEKRAGIAGMEGVLSPFRDQMRQYNKRNRLAGSVLRITRMSARWSASGAKRGSIRI